MSNIPKLRFPEFSGEWEEKKIIQFCEISAGGDIDKNNSQKEYSSSYPYSVYSNSLENKGLYGYANYYKIDSDVVTVTGRGDVGHAVARHEKFVPIVRLLVCKPKNNENVNFLENAINKTKIFIESTGVPQLTAPQLGNVKLFLPSLAEQQKIADFLSNVDSIITAETKILNTLQKKKKALMQKLFTQQLRFKSEDGTNFPAWEEKKLGEIAIFSKGNGYSKSDLVSNGTPIILYGRLYTKYETSISEVDTFVLEKKNSVISKGDEIIVPASGETAEDISRASVVKHAGIILGGDLNIIEVDLNHYIPEYIALCISNGEPKKRMAKLAQGKTIVHLHNSDLQQLIFSIPCKEEQQKIADCLSSIDSLIQTQQKVVTTWQQRKKALLQQMFI